MTQNKVTAYQLKKTILVEPATHDRIKSLAEKTYSNMSDVISMLADEYDRAIYKAQEKPRKEKQWV